MIEIIFFFIGPVTFANVSTKTQIDCFAHCQHYLAPYTAFKDLHPFRVYTVTCIDYDKGISRLPEDFFSSGHDRTHGPLARSRRSPDGSCLVGGRAAINHDQFCRRVGFVDPCRVRV